jgi:hypothetical protein
LHNQGDRERGYRRMLLIGAPGAGLLGVRRWRWWMWGRVRARQIAAGLATSLDGPNRVSAVHPYG